MKTHGAKGFLLVLCVTVILFLAMTVTVKLRNDMNEETCKHNLRMISTALMVYAQCYRERLPPADSWCEQISGQIGTNPENHDSGSEGTLFWIAYSPENEKRLQCPNDRQHRYGYAMNSILNCAALGNLDANTPIIFESSANRLNANDSGESIALNRHRSGCFCIYGDWTVRWTGRRPNFAAYRRETVAK